jgi:hypothetical protein
MFIHKVKTSSIVRYVIEFENIYKLNDKTQFTISEDKLPIEGKIGILLIDDECQFYIFDDWRHGFSINGNTITVIRKSFCHGHPAMGIRTVSKELLDIMGKIDEVSIVANLPKIFTELDKIKI